MSWKTLVVELSATLTQTVYQMKAEISACVKMDGVEMGKPALMLTNVSHLGTVAISMPSV